MLSFSILRYNIVSTLVIHRDCAKETGWEQTVLSATNIGPKLTDLA